MSAGLEGIARVLSEHGGEWTWNRGKFTDPTQPILCGCGWQGCIVDHRTHVAAAVVAWIEGVLGGDEVREAINSAQYNVIADHNMWIGADGEPLDYLPEREARISHYLQQATTAALAATAGVLRGKVGER